MQNTETTVISFLNKLPELWRQRADSLAEHSAITRNEYITLVEEPLSSLDYLPSLLSHIEVLLGCNMLSSISLLVGMPTVDVIGTLDKVATKRDPIGSALGGGSKLAAFVSGESARIGLPAYKDLQLCIGEARTGSNRTIRGDMVSGANATQKSYNSDSFNNTDSNNVNQHNANNTDKKDSDNKNSTFDNHNSNNVVGNTNTDQSDHRKITTYNNDSSKGKSKASFGKDTLRQLTEASALSTGKQFEVNFERDGNTCPVLMTLKLDVNLIASEDMRTLVAFSDQTNTFGERLLKAKAGHLSWGKDIILQNDLIDQARKNRFRDKTGYYAKMMSRRSSNWLSSILSFDMSINNASGVMVVSQQTVDDLTAELGGELSDFEVRSRVFKDSLTVYIAVVDTQWDSITLYTRGQKEYTTMRASDLTGGKSTGKMTGNVDDIIRAYNSGANPQIF